MKNPAAVALGSMKSKRKAIASRRNGKLGGRPRKVQTSMKTNEKQKWEHTVESSFRQGWRVSLVLDEKIVMVRGNNQRAEVSKTDGKIRVDGGRPRKDLEGVGRYSADGAQGKPMPTKPKAVGNG